MRKVLRTLASTFIHTVAEIAGKLSLPLRMCHRSPFYIAIRPRSLTATLPAHYFTGLAPVNRHQRPLLLINFARILRHLRHTAHGIRHDAAPNCADAVSPYALVQRQQELPSCLRSSHGGGLRHMGSLHRPRRLHRRRKYIASTGRGKQPDHRQRQARRVFTQQNFKARSIMTVS